MRFLRFFYGFIVAIIVCSGLISNAIGADQEDPAPTYTFKLVLSSGACNGSTYTFNNREAGSTVWIDSYFENNGITWPPHCEGHYYDGCEDSATGDIYKNSMTMPWRDVTCNAIWRSNISCSAGQYHTGTDAGNTCAACTKGYFCTGITNISPTTVDQGRTPCPIGSYNNETGKLTCKVCTSGKTTSSKGQTSCNGTCTNNANVITWKNPYWDSSLNDVKDVCKISSCEAGYHVSSDAKACVANTYTVKFNANPPTAPAGYTNTATGTMADKTWTYGTEYDVPGIEYSVTGYEFSSWNTKANGTGTRYIDDGKTTISNLTTTNGGTVTLYAQWTAKTYTITIPNGTCNQTSLTLNPTYDQNFTFEPVCARYIFKGCHDNETGKTPIPESGISGVYRGSSDFSCTIEWQKLPITCAAGYYLIDSDTAGASNLAENDNGCRQCSRTGYFCPGGTFTDGITASEQGRYECPIGSYNAQYSGASTCTLCPKGKKTARTGTGTPEACSIDCGNKTDKVNQYTAPVFYVTNVLYLCKIDTCIGGYHPEDVSGQDYPNQCVANKYSVKYDRNKPSNASNEVQGTTVDSHHVYDTGSALTTNGYTLKGWDFVDWNTRANGQSGNAYQDGAYVHQLTTSNNVTVILYAQWKPRETSLSFDKNATDATAGSTTQSCTAKYDNAMPNCNTKLPTRQGYTFKGYFDATEGGNKYYNADGTSARTWNKTDDSVTLYAQWDKCAKGYYCQGDNSKLSCPAAFYSDAGATYITQCYLRTDIKLADKFNPTGISLFPNVSTPDNSQTEKIYYIGDNN